MIITLPEKQARLNASARRVLSLCATANLALFAGVVAPVGVACAQTPSVTQPLGGGTSNGSSAAPTTQPFSSSAAGSGTGPSSARVVPDNYRLDTGDVISIEVQRHGAMSRQIRLYNDALIRLPRLTSAVAARGRTCAEIAAELTRKMQTEGKLRLVTNAVSVSVMEMRPRRIYVRGNAGKSGDFNLLNDWRITEVVAVIGGVPTPERTTVRILNPSRPAPLSLNLANALANPDSADNVYLQEGDTLTIDMPRQKRFLIKGEGPRGEHEIDERLGLRQALTKLGFAATNATGDLRHSRLLRHETPGDPNSPTTPISVDLYTLLTSEEAPDIALQDLDTLNIPLSQNFIYIYGESSAPHKWQLPEDRPTRLVDVMALGSTSGRAKIDSIQIYRKEWVDKNGNAESRSFKFGKFLSKNDMTQNPEIKAGDIVYVPAVNRPDVIGGIWQSWGLFGIVQSLIPGARIR